MNPAPSTPQDLVGPAIAYVRFALDRPALFRVMFAEPCDPAHEERAAAAAALSAFLHDIVGTVFPDADIDPLSTAVWALVHGLAFLHLDGKLDTSSSEAVAEQIRSALNAALAIRSAERRGEAPAVGVFLELIWCRMGPVRLSGVVRRRAAVCR